MSTSQESTSFVDEAEPLPESNPTESSLDKKVGMAQKFDKEMKDYAKATVKEFLGIYGYEEDVDINIDDSGEGVGPRSETNTNSDTQSESSNSNQQTSQAEARIMERTSNEAGTVVKEEDSIEGLTSYFDQNCTDSEISSVFTGDLSNLSQKDKSRLRMRWRRLNETPEMRTSRLKVQRERARTRRANETQAEREFRLVKDRVRQKLKRTYESEGDREKRLQQQRESARRRRALESPEQKQARQLRDRERTRRSREAKRAGVAVEWW